MRASIQKKWEKGGISERMSLFNSNETRNWYAIQRHPPSMSPSMTIERSLEIRFLEIPIFSFIMIIVQIVPSLLVLHNIPSNVEPATHPFLQESSRGGDDP
jgi:hypothetical protein